MSTDAIESLRLNLEDLGSVLASLSATEWQTASACPGWRMQDVVAHMNSSAKVMTGQQAPPSVDGDPVGAEATAELLIEEQKTWDWERVYEEFQTLRDPFLVALSAMQDEPVASTEMDLGDLGTHPMRILANAFAFDAYCHLRHDIVGVATSIDRELAEPDEARLRPGIDWMLAGLPQMCATTLSAAATGSVQLALTGAGGGMWLIGAAVDNELIDISEGSGDADATVTSTAHDFYSWATKRSDWRAACAVEGDPALAAAVLDAANVI